MYNVSQPIYGLRTPLECQQKCRDTEGCAVFGYFSRPQTCFLGPRASHIVVDLGSVAGPARCQSEPPACSATLPAQFPGNTAAETLEVTTTGLVPLKLQCWPRSLEGKLLPCDDEPVVVLEDYAKGWAAQCTDLRQVMGITAEDCEDHCRSDVNCASFQLQKTSWGSQCWQGMGYKCFSKSRGLVPVAAKRFQRGHVRVLKDLAGIQVMGLQNAFSAEDLDNTSFAISSCRKTCYSSIHCSVWIFSKDHGCYVEDTTRAKLEWPPTTSTFNAASYFAKTVVAGEFIQHQCGNFKTPEESQPDSSCASYPRCSGIVGQCCPTPIGHELDCCDRGGRNVSGLDARPNSTTPALADRLAQLTRSAKVATDGPALESDWQITFDVTNLNMSTLDNNQEQSLAEGYGSAVASALELPPTDVKDLHGNPRQASLSSVDGQPPTQVDVVARTPGGTADDVASVLGDASFTQSVQKVTAGAVSTSDEVEGSNLNVRPWSGWSSTAQPVESQVMEAVQKVEDEAESALRTDWFAIALVSVLVLAVCVMCVLLWFHKPSLGGAKKRTRSANMQRTLAVEEGDEACDESSVAATETPRSVLATREDEVPLFGVPHLQVPEIRPAATAFAVPTPVLQNVVPIATAQPVMQPIMPTFGRF